MPLTRPRRVRAAVLATVGALAGAPLAPAQSTAPSSPARGPHDPVEVDAFISGLMTAYLREHHVAGGVVAIVRDTAVIFTRGFGWADVEKRTPVDPARTLFRNGSITKTFTWTAVMQLVEQGKLDLDADINTYLDFRIPATWPQPVTLHHILTHTAGFEEDSRELFSEDSARIRPLKEWLPAHMPRRVRAPGTWSAYSNWASATAGYIVERVSGMPYDEYVDRHILQPLGMANATTRQPLPAAFEAQMSKGYSWNNGRWDSKKWEIITGAWPAGSMSVSGGDMAIWMLAHLNKGAWRGQRILAESTAIRMQSRLQGHDPRLPGFAHGFYEQTPSGPRAIGHGGDTRWFHSNMMLLPAERVGVFVSFNTAQGAAVSFKPFLDDFLAHYYPESLPVLAPARDDRKANARFAGEYLSNRMSYSTFQKAIALAGAVRVSVADSGALVAGTPRGTVRFVRVDSLLFRDVASNELLAFHANPDGTITHAFLSMLPMGTLEKASTLGSPTLHLVVLGLGIVTFLGILVAAVVRWFGARSSGRVPPDPLISRGRGLMLGVAVLAIGFVVAIAVLAGDAETLLLNGELGRLKAALALPVVAALACAGALVVAVLQWLAGAGTLATRVRHGLAVLVAIAFFWSLNTWNLLGWRF